MDVDVDEEEEEDVVDSPTQSDRVFSDDSEVESLCSSDGASEASASDSPTQSDKELSDDDSEAGERAPRAKRGAFTIFSNGYFTIKQDPKNQDVKITAAKRFCTPHGLGDKLMSKTIPVKKNGETLQSYPRTLACLHAWMVPTGGSSVTIKRQTSNMSNLCFLGYPKNSINNAPN